MTEWQSINEAPKDRVVLLYSPLSYVEVSMGYFDEAWMMLSDDGEFAESNPTHWQDLPEAPPE